MGTSEGGQRFSKLKKGAFNFVPKPFKFRTDRTTSRALVNAIETLNASDIDSPYPYKHMHPLALDTALGSDMDGTVSMNKMFTDRRDEKEVKNDILQET